jgi:peptide/nickel transport system permease protein
MLWYVARRLAGTVGLLGAVVVATFGLMYLAPGDVAQVLAGQSGDAQYLAELREQFSLDRSLGYQIGAYLLNVARGDLGFSVVQGRPVLEAILSRLPATLLLAGTSLTIAWAAGVLLGVLAASRPGSRLDAGISIVSLVGYSIPVFWFGQLLVALLAVRLGWLPAGGMTSAGEQLGAFERVLDVARHLILPSATLGILLMALVIRTTRAAMLDVLGDDYVMAARGRGIREEAVLLRHALRNALRPVITVITAELGVVLGVMVLVEAVFSWPGLGTLLLDSVLSRDTPTLVGLLLFSSFVVAAANLLGDLLYMWVDPRVRYR